MSDYDNQIPQSNGQCPAANCHKGVSESEIPRKGDSNCCDTCKKEYDCAKCSRRCLQMRSPPIPCLGCQWCEEHSSEGFTRADLLPRSDKRLIQSHIKSSGKVKKW